jgi:hypothetical protein
VHCNHLRIFMSWARRHPVLTGALVLFSIPVIAGTLDFSGMCLAQGRWLSKDERIRLFTSNFRGHADLNYLLEQSSSMHDEFAQYEPVPYKDSQDFLSSNPDCCEAIGSYSDGPIWRATFLDRIFGLRADVLRIRYTARFLDRGGKLHELKDYTEYPVITNCGTILSRP